MRWLSLLLLLWCVPFAWLLSAEQLAPSSTGTTPAAPAVAPVGAHAVASEKNNSAAPLFTDAEWQRQPQRDTEVPTGGAVVGQAAFGLFVSLVIIGLLAWGLAWASKRLGMRRVLPGRGRHMQVMETLPLGLKRAVSLIRIHDQVLVIGQGEHELCHLATLPASQFEPETNAPVVPPVATDGDSDPDANESPAPVPTSAPSAFRQVLETLGVRRS